MYHQNKSLFHFLNLKTILCTCDRSTEIAIHSVENKRQKSDDGIENRCSRKTSISSNGRRPYPMNCDEGGLLFDMSFQNLVIRFIPRVLPLSEMMDTQQKTKLTRQRLYLHPCSLCRDLPHKVFD